MSTLIEDILENLEEGLIKIDYQDQANELQQAIINSLRYSNLPWSYKFRGKRVPESLLNDVTQEFKSPYTNIVFTEYIRPEGRGYTPGPTGYYDVEIFWSVKDHKLVEIE